jgi:hypothetical protein
MGISEKIYVSIIYKAGKNEKYITYIYGSESSFV